MAGGCEKRLLICGERILVTTPKRGRVIHKGVKAKGKGKKKKFVRGGWGKT